MRELHVLLHMPFPKGQVPLLIGWVRTPIHGLWNPIKQGVSLISHICLYPPCRCHMPASFYLLIHNSTIIAEYKVELCHSVSWSWVNTEYSIYPVQHTPSTAYPKYSIHWLQHTLTTASTQHQQNVKWFRSHNSTIQLVWTATPIRSEAPRSSRTGWMQNNVLLRCSESTFRCSSTLLK